MMFLTMSLALYAFHIRQLVDAAMMTLVRQLVAVTPAVETINCQM